MFTESKYNQFIDYNGKTILYNFLSCAMVEIGRNYFYRKLEQADQTDNEFLTLYEYDFVNKDDEQINRIIDSYNNEKNNKESMNITIELTNSCNFRCKYCYQDHLTNFIDENKSDKIISFIENKIVDGMKYLHIHWFGGEPTLNLDQAVYLDSKITGMCDKYGVIYTASMTTNGYTIKENYKKIKLMKIDNFQITLDGIEIYHDFTRHLKNGQGTFKKILDNVKFLDDEGYSVVIRYNVNKRNFKIKEFIDFIKKQHFSSNVKLHIQGTNKFENSEDTDNLYFENTEEYSKYLLKIYEDLKENEYEIPKYKNFGTNCPFDCMNNFYINSELKILRCSSCDNSKESQIATIKDGSLVFNKEALDKKEKYIGFKKDKCEDCNMLPICKGGCYLKHSLNQNECIPEKYFVEDYVRLLYEQAKR
ncbi:radical SAM protein [uncultured Anaerococcus sp.]|uniref:radical SAM/SPASM domain-containing protein n=1 Tax=uncultured Anaerococcus sp. TaxID=293428 RepID=UPI0026286A80|nr:radical SAM protein [uncultured Anaerococcus sp.]